MKKSVHTKRLLLAPLGENDREALIALLRNDGITATYMAPPLETEEKQAAMFERLRAISLDEGRFFYGIFLNVKLIGLIHEVEVSDGIIELGCFIDPAEQGRGYGSEALKEAMELLFGAGFLAVRAGAFIENAASRRMMLKCGMQPTGETETISYRGRGHECVYYEKRIG